MKLQEVLDAVKRMTYKPGYTFDAFPLRGTESVQVFVATTVPDADEPSRMVKVKIALTIDLLELRDVGALCQRVKFLLLDLEQHESHEWFRYAGARVTKPHLPPTRPPS